MNFQYKTGLVIGRFQPFHLGHLYLIQKALEHAEKIVIIVGSSNVHDENNPLSYEKRVEMLKKVIEHEGWGDRIIKIVPSPDDPSDDEWLKLLLANVGSFDLAIGNNDWTNDILEGAGIKVLKLPYYNRELYQGAVVRKLFDQHGNWQEIVPPYLTDFIEKELSGNS